MNKNLKAGLITVGVVVVLSGLIWVAVKHPIGTMLLIIGLMVTVFIYSFVKDSLK